jgi:hypothetical protein
MYFFSLDCIKMILISHPPPSENPPQRGDEKVQRVALEALNRLVW